MDTTTRARLGSALLATAEADLSKIWNDEQGPVGSAHSFIRGVGARHVFRGAGDFVLFKLAYLLFNPKPAGARSLSAPELLALEPHQLHVVGEIFVALANGEQAVEKWLSSRGA